MRLRISPKQEKLLGAAPIGACLDEPTRWRYEGIDEVSMHLSIGWKRLGFVIGLLFIATATVAAAVAWLDYTAPVFPPSLFQPALARQLTDEEKQKLDLELLNQALMISSSRRFRLADEFSSMHTAETCLSHTEGPLVVGNEFIKLPEASASDIAKQISTPQPRSARRLLLPTKSSLHFHERWCSGLRQMEAGLQKSDADKSLQQPPLDSVSPLLIYLEGSLPIP